MGTRQEKVDPAQFPFTIRAFSQGIDLDFASPVTFFVGENGTGKSTLLEALAEGCGFDTSSSEPADARDESSDGTGVRQVTVAMHAGEVRLLYRSDLQLQTHNDAQYRER